MKPKQIFEWHASEFEDYDWLFAPEDEKSGSDIFPIRENIAKAAKLYGVPAEFLENVDDAMRNMANEIIGAFKMDLEDLHDLLED